MAAEKAAVKVAVVQAALVAFPKSFIPAYPDWVWAIPPGVARRIPTQRQPRCQSPDPDNPAGARACIQATAAGGWNNYAVSIA